MIQDSSSFFVSDKMSDIEIVEDEEDEISDQLSSDYPTQLNSDYPTQLNSDYPTQIKKIDSELRDSSCKLIN